MCVPCKIVINEGSDSSAALATIIANFMIDAERGELPPPNDDEELYRLALAEVEFRESVREAGVAMARKVGAPRRWFELMERL